MQYRDGDKVITKVKHWGLGVNKNNKPFVLVTFANNIKWQGYLVEGALKITTKALYNMGFKGASAYDLKKPDALDKARDVEIEIMLEDYNGKMQTKVRWVNKPYKKKELKADEVKQMQGIDLRAYIQEHQQEDGISQYANGSGKTHSNDQAQAQDNEYQQQTGTGTASNAHDDIPF